MNSELYGLAIKDIMFNRYFMATGGGYDLGLYGNDKLEFVITIN